MRRVLWVSTVSVLLLSLGAVARYSAIAQESPSDHGADKKALSFGAFDLWIDSGTGPLAAYQVEISYDKEILKIVGIEGGDAAYRPAPYYDGRGLEAGRIVVAAFTTDRSAAPTGKTRVARIHTAFKGDSPVLKARVMAAAKPGGERIAVELRLSGAEEGE